MTYEERRFANLTGVGKFMAMTGCLKYVEPSFKKGKINYGNFYELRKWHPLTWIYATIRVLVNCIAGIACSFFYEIRDTYSNLTHYLNDKY